MMMMIYNNIVGKMYNQSIYKTAIFTLHYITNQLLVAGSLTNLPENK